MAILKSLGAFGVTREKMFSVSRLWEGVKLHVRAIILLSYGTPSSVPSRAKILHNLVSRLVTFERDHGSLTTVKWVKANHVALQKFLGGDSLESLRGLEPNIPLPRLYSGLPSIINKRDRRRIQRGCTKTIQFWLSCFSLYRVTLSEFVPKLQSIYGDYTGDKAFSWGLLDYIDDAPRGNPFSRLEKYSSWRESVNITPKAVAFIQSSSPSNRVSWHGLLTDAVAMSRSKVFKFFVQYIALTKAVYFKKIFEEALSLSALVGPNNLNQKKSSVDCLGQLSFKEEAAGKLRVFALVDVWTQSLLKPLHSALFDLLRLIPNDGTFDQDASVRRSVSKASVADCAYSFDLSSATDRLPVVYQSALLDRILPVKVGNAWAGLLTLREYYLPGGAKKYGITEKSMTYTVGQPMGALSSWAMLALTHHYLLQYCASRAVNSVGWFENYEILGDDLVIFDHAVAAEYLELMKKIGLEINLSKSISSPSRPVFEFAKRTVVQGINVSGISVKQLISATSMGARVGNVLHFAGLGLIRTNTILSTLLGRFYKTDVKSVMLPSLALLGSLFKSGKISLKALVTVLIDPKDDEFDFNTSKFSLPLLSVLTAQKELLNSKVEKLDLLRVSSVEEREELFDELESDITASVLLRALQRAKELENSYDELTGSGAYARCLVKDGVDFASLPIGTIAVAQLDGWVTELITNCDKFDMYELVEEIDKINHDHAKYPRLSLEQALPIAERVERWWMRFDIVRQKRTSSVETLSPVYSWLASSQGFSRTGYLVERKFIMYE
uniref:RNA-dependent RNA polymerase n=1 Tax=Sclerotinia sclerotiorum mitovirus 28 TaxID=2231680 RepID=A0A2Z4QKE3_9VIRU|nr:RNA-dependent RNA polymerase [Sclerotinia sclerotiorum mitovirus 28]